MSRGAFQGALATIALLVIVQSAAHLIAVGPFGSSTSVVDLDRSGAIPDLVSTAVIAIAAGSAGVLALRAGGRVRLTAALLVPCLVLTGVDDVIGVDRDVAAAATLVGTGAALALTAVAVAASSVEPRPALALAVGLAALVATLLIGQLPWLEPWFDRARGDAVMELQIVLKQGLELVGWSLVALGAWDAARSAQRSRGAVRR